MGELLVKAIPLILPALIVASFIVNHWEVKPPKLNAKRESSSNSQKAEEQSASSNSEPTVTDDDMTSG